MSAATSKIQSVQHWRKHVLRLLFLFWVAMMLFSQSLWVADAAAHEALEYAGMALIGTAILGRTWSSLYIGGRKNAVLMQDGPYSLMRNPLYTFSFIGAVGIGLQLGSGLFGLITLAICVLVFWPVVRKEEQHLDQLFGDAYAQYRRTVPRFLPNLLSLRSKWRGVETLEVRPALVVRTFADASLFALAIPAMELVEHAQFLDWLPIVLVLP